MIRSSALATLGLTMTPSVLMSLESCARRRPTMGLPKYLQEEQYDVLWVIAERILPRTEAPGADDAGVAPFIDLLIGEYFDDADRSMHLDGLQQFMQNCRADTGHSFLDLSEPEQMEYLSSLDQKGAGDAFFSSLRKIILWAFFTSEVGMKSMNYLPIPGRYQGCITIDDQEKNLVGNR